MTAKAADRPVTIHTGNLLWLGEHWINSLRPTGVEKPSAIVSHFHTRYSPAGEGNAALIRIGGPKGFHAVCTDNAELGRFVTERFFKRVDYFDAGLPTAEAR